MTERKRGDRQIIGKGSIPVEIVKNTQSERHSSKTTLAVGGIETVGGLKRAKAEANEDRYRRLQEITDTIRAGTMARCIHDNPDFPLDYVYTSSRDPWRPIDSQYTAAEAEYRNTHPELVEELAGLERDIRDARDRTYAFADWTRDKDDVYVGKEGSLMYSEVSGDRVADELVAAFDRRAKYLAEVEGPGMTMRLNRRLMAVQAGEPRDELVAKLRAAKSVVDIHQVEVLAPYRGKGIASALLDVAHWDVGDVNKADFAVARVLDDNPHWPEVIGMFEKNGYRGVYCPGMGGTMTGGIPNYTMMIREFPRRGR